MTMRQIKEDMFRSRIANAYMNGDPDTQQDRIYEAYETAKSEGLLQSRLEEIHKIIIEVLKIKLDD